MKESLNEQERLQIIYETIENAKTNVKDNGFFYLLWGWLVLIASLLQYILLNYTSFKHHYLGWPVLMTLGAIASVIYGIRLGNRASIRTHLDNIIIGLWWAFFVLLLTIIILTIAGPFNFGITSPLIILLFSFATFVSGVILKYNPLKIGGTLSWIVGIIAFLVTPENQLLMTALAIIIAYLIPGYMLKYRK
jgi:hypothetical protein